MHKPFFTGKISPKWEIKDSKFKKEVILEAFSHQMQGKKIKIARFIYLVFIVEPEVSNDN